MEEKKIRIKPLSERIFSDKTINFGFCIFVAVNGLVFIIASISSFANSSSRPLLSRVYSSLVMVLVMNSANFLLASFKLVTDKFPSIKETLFGNSLEWADSCFKLICLIFNV